MVTVPPCLPPRPVLTVSGLMIVFTVKPANSLPRLGCELPEDSAPTQSTAHGAGPPGKHEKHLPAKPLNGPEFPGDLGNVSACGALPKWDMGWGPAVFPGREVFPQKEDVIPD